MEKSKFKKILKIVFLAATGCIALVAFLIFIIIQQLPSINKIANFLGPEKSKNEITSPVGSLELVTAESVSMTEVVSSNATVDEDVYATTTESDESVSQSAESLQNSKSLIKDLLDPSTPLSNFCKSLKNASEGTITDQDIAKSVDESAAKPTVQAIKPTLRSLFRLPAVQSLINEAEQARASGQDESFFDKAAFYGKAALALTDIKSNLSDLEAVTDRGYLFYKLNSVVAQHPELINDQRLNNFCDQTENSFNTGQPVQFDQEKKNFERLLTELNVDTKSVGYDPNYKTTLDASIQQMDGQFSLLLKGGWLEETMKKQ